MTGAVICGKCPNVYPAEQIVAVFGEEKSTLAKLQQNPSPPRRRRVGSRRKSGREGVAANIWAPEDFAVLELLRDWTFLCPNEHVVDANEGVALPVAVLGQSGASKTHFLPALVYELRDLNTLRSLGVKLRPATYLNPELENNKDRLYAEGQELPRTNKGDLLGPYGYKLTVSLPSDQATVDEDFVLQLFDVAGEDLETIVKIASNAKFIYLCRALIVLLDPVDILATRFTMGMPPSTQERVRSATRVRNSIDTLADAIQQVWKKSVAELKLPVCFVVAKADAIDWVFDYINETSSIVQKVRGGEDIRTVLLKASEDTKEAFRSAGGEAIVDEIEDRFPIGYTRFVAATATSGMPNGPDENGRIWQDPTPNGAALAMLQILDMLDAFGRRD